jgi:hypothetical protein
LTLELTLVLDPDRFRLLMDGLLLAAGLVMLWAAAT